MNSAPAGGGTDGILVINKPAGWTSHDVVAKVRRICRTRRVGHTGTLDPFATGVLVVCLNQATRIVRYLTGDEKEYRAVMRLGFRTDTGDLTGNPVETPADASGITASDLRLAVESFSGRISQVPPMYSAKKIGGVKLYEMARRGEEVERRPIEVEIREIELTSGPQPDAPGALTAIASFRVVCSSGTYVSTLAEDIGRRLEIGAHLVELRRTRAGRCSLDQAVTIEELEKLAADGRIQDAVTGMSDALEMTEIPLSESELRDVSHGRPIRSAGGFDHGMTAILSAPVGRPAAIAEFDADRAVWLPRIVFTHN